MSGARTTLSGPSHQATPSKLNRTCLKTQLSSEDCTRGEDGRETVKRKTKKEDVESTNGARGQEDQLRGAEERSTEPGRMTPSSMKPALGQSTQRKDRLNSFDRRRFAVAGRARQLEIRCLTIYETQYWVSTLSILTWTLKLTCF